MVTISTDKLIENPETKKIYGSSDDSTLKLSISLLGVLEPLIVFQVGDSDQYQIISGNRRLSVAKELGLSELPATIINPKNIDKVITIGHNEQRRKLPSHYIREYRTYNDLHNLTQGKKSTESKEAIEQRNQLFRDIAKSTLDRYLSIDKIAQKLADGDNLKYEKLMGELDSSGSADGTRKLFLKRLEDKENVERIAADFEYHSPEAVIYQKSSADLSVVADGSVAVVVTSPPYYEMRDYKSGDKQLGHEESEEVFVERLVKHFDDCKRVLDERGTVWVNLGDFTIDFSYKMVPEKFTIGMMNRGWILHDKIIWLKNNPVFNNAERSLVAHEYIYVFKKNQFVNYSFDWLRERDVRDNRFVIGVRGDKVKLRSIFDFRNGVLTTNVANNARFREYCDRAGIHLTHSATFPISIPTIAILTTTKEMDLVCDPFNGTATTGRSALLFFRRYVGFDVNPTYIKQSEIRLNMPTKEDLEYVKRSKGRVGRNPISREETMEIKAREMEYMEDVKKQIKTGIDNGFTVISAFSVKF